MMSRISPVRGWTSSRWTGSAGEQVRPTSRSGRTWGSPSSQPSRERTGRSDRSGHGKGSPSSVEAACGPPPISRSASPSVPMRVYLGTAALIAINCEQYRICHTGRCPTGVTTQDPILGEQLDVGKGNRTALQFYPGLNRRDGRFHADRGKAPDPGSGYHGPRCPQGRARPPGRVQRAGWAGNEGIRR